MWSRARLKEEAKRILKINYWLPLLVTFVAGLLGVSGSGIVGGGGNGGVTATSSMNVVSSIPPSGIQGFDGFYMHYDRIFNEMESAFSRIAVAIPLLIGFVIAMLVGFAAAFAVYAFLTGPVIVGQKRFFMENRAFESKFSRLFWAFGNGSYMHIAKIMFFVNLKVFLWSLLFVIPGIIKSYEYRMIPYILAENPEISMERAFELSAKMTSGEKWNIFVLDLSFIGWHLLGFLACCIGGYFVRPYEEATNSELYQVMREKALALTFSDSAELPGFMPDQYR